MGTRRSLEQCAEAPHSSKEARGKFLNLTFYTQIHCLNTRGVLGGYMCTQKSFKSSFMHNFVLEILTFPFKQSFQCSIVHCLNPIIAANVFSYYKTLLQL